MVGVDTDERTIPCRQRRERNIANAARRVAGEDVCYAIHGYYIHTAVREVLVLAGKLHRAAFVILLWWVEL